MRLFNAALATVVFCLSAPVVFVAQSLQPSPAATIPRLINLSGVFQPADGQPLATVEIVTLSIYADETGGAPVWRETQSVQPDAAGRYTLLLGATLEDGIPLEVFASGDARWLGMTFARPGEVEGPRTRLTSVPYALRAADADTLGGRPASEYLLAPASGGESGRAKASSPDTIAVASADVVNPGTTNFLAKYVNAADVGNSAVFETGGQVGIGTTGPFDTLHVRLNNTGGTATGYAVQNLGNTAASYSGMLFYDQNGALGQFQGFNNVTHEYRINNIATSPGGSINFMIGSVSRFLVNSGGNIGIGTTSPDATVEVSRPGPASLYLTGYSGGTASFVGRSASGTEAAPSAIGAGEVLVLFGATGYNGNDFDSTSFMRMTTTESWTPTATGTKLGFAVTANGTNATLVAMTINEDGAVGIGDETPADKLQVVGNIRVGTSGTNGCVKRFDGTGIVGTCSSDARLKKEIVSFGPALGSLTALRPVHYFWRAAEFPEKHFGDSRTYGLIAQEVEQVLPELVVTEEDGFKAVDYTKLPLLTIQAIKELKAQHDALQVQHDALETTSQTLASQNQTLDASNRALEARVAELERLVKALLTTASSR